MNPVEGFFLFPSSPSKISRIVLPQPDIQSPGLKEEVLAVYFDGLCEPKNPGGVSTYGFVVYRGQDKLVACKGLAAEPFSPDSSNNVGEYYGLIRALEWLSKNPKIDKSSKIQVQGDSKVVIAQMRGEFKTRSKRLSPLNTKARELAEGFPNMSFRWIPRSENVEADGMSRLAYEEYMKKVGLKPTYRSHSFQRPTQENLGSSTQRMAKAVYPLSFSLS
jgi:ribonuclease HI